MGDRKNLSPVTHDPSLDFGGFMTDKRIDDYLRKSTRGLWGRKKAEVREELSAHIGGRVHGYLVAGYSECEAIKKTLTELGHPINVSAGMVRLHTLPIVAGSGMALAMSCALVVVLLSGSTAQTLAGTFYWPSSQCLVSIDKGEVSTDVQKDYQDGKLTENSACMQADNSLWLSLQELKQALEPQGVKIETGEGSLASITFPNGEQVTFSRGRSDVCAQDTTGECVPTDPNHFSFWDMVSTVVEKSGVNLRVIGWDNPKITLDTATFTIGTDQQPIKGEDFYDNYLNKVLFSLPNLYFGSYVANVSQKWLDIIAPDWDRSLIKQEQLRLQATSENGVYGIVVVLDLENPLATMVEDKDYPDDSAFFLEVAGANSDNTITFNLPVNENVRFVSKLKALPEPGDAILVELSGKQGAWYSIIPPDQIQME
jgi:hypothetical protein